MFRVVREFLELVLGFAFSALEGFFAFSEASYAHAGHFVLLQVEEGFALFFVESLHVDAVEVDVVRVFVENVDEGVDFLVGNDPIFVAEIIKNFFEFLEVFHVADFTSDNFVIKVSQDTDQKGQNNVVQNEHHR